MSEQLKPITLHFGAQTLEVPQDGRAEYLVRFGHYTLKEGVCRGAYNEHIRALEDELGRELTRQEKSDISYKDIESTVEKAIAEGRGEEILNHAYDIGMSELALDAPWYCGYTEPVPFEGKTGEESV